MRPDAEPPRKPRFLAMAPAPRPVEAAEFSASTPAHAVAGPAGPHARPAPPAPRAAAPSASAEPAMPVPFLTPPAVGAAGHASAAPSPAAASPAAPPPAALAPAALSPALLPLPPPLSLPSLAEAPSAAANDRLEAALRSLQELGTRLYGEARADALEVGFLIARRILETEIRQSPEPLFQLVRTALQKVGEARPVTLRVHPEDALRLHAPPTGAPSLVDVHVLGDPALARGDVVIEAAFGSVDARLDTRLAELHRSAVASLQEEP